MSLKMVNKAELEKDMAGSKPVVMLFGATWCGYCKRLKPAVMQVAEELSDKVLFDGIDVDQENELAAKYKIDVIPTMILVDKGQASEQLVNPPSQADIKQWLQGKGVI